GSPSAPAPRAGAGGCPSPARGCCRGPARPGRQAGGWWWTCHARCCRGRRTRCARGPPAAGPSVSAVGRRTYRRPAVRSLHLAWGVGSWLPAASRGPAHAGVGALAASMPSGRKRGKPNQRQGLRAKRGGAGGRPGRGGLLPCAPRYPIHAAPGPRRGNGARPARGLEKWHRSPGPSSRRRAGAGQPMSMRGTLFIVAAPSGAGKSSIVNAVLSRDPAIRLSISFTSRAPRPGERHAEHYHFVSEEEFQRMIDAGDFFEYARVHGDWKGTARQSVEPQLAAGHDVLLEIDWQGAAQVRAKVPDAVSVFILPPSREALEQRMRK